MADVHRFRHADPKRVRSFPVDSATVIEVGDMVFQATDDVRPASDFTFVTGSLSRTQANFRRDFKGIAMDASANGDTANISVAQAGTFEMNCAAATFEIGDRVGADDNAGGTALVDDQVVALTENDYGEIGKIVKRYSANTTRCLVEITPSVPSQPLAFAVFEGSTTTAGDLVTNLVMEYPFKLARVTAIVTAAYTGTDVITIRNGATALDDTVSVTGAAGAVVSTAMDDATGDDIFDAGDQLDVATDGASTAGSAIIILEVIPFLHHD